MAKRQRAATKREVLVSMLAHYCALTIVDVLEEMGLKEAEAMKVLMATFACELAFMVGGAHDAGVIEDTDTAVNDLAQLMRAKLAETVNDNRASVVPSSTRTKH